MKQQTTFNIEQVVSVRVVDEQEADFFNFQEAKKRRFAPDRKEGFVHNHQIITDHVFSAEELKAGQYCGITFIVRNKSVFYRPYVKIKFSNGEQRVENFATYAEAFEWSKGIKIKETLIFKED